MELNLRELLIEIVCTRTNQQLKDLREAYQQMYGEGLLKVLNKWLKPKKDYWLRLVIFNLLQMKRYESEDADVHVAKQDAKVCLCFCFCVFVSVSVCLFVCLYAMCNMCNLTVLSMVFLVCYDLLWAFFLFLFLGAVFCFLGGN